MRGRFSSLARPEDVHDFELSHLEPSAHARDGENVFTAEADAELEDAWMRAGMQGLAKIEVGERPVWWVLFHRFEDWVRMDLRYLNSGSMLMDLKLLCRTVGAVLSGRGAW